MHTRATRPNPGRRALARGARTLLVAIGAPLALALAASGCSLKADVAATGTTAGNVTHLYVTVQEVWLATGADTPVEATAGWVKSVLATPVTIDLATLTPGALTALATAIALPAGTYRQLHLVTADSADSLVASASALGLTANSEISITATDGTSTTTPLESPVPGAGLTIATDLVLAGSLDVGQTSSATTTSTSTTSSGKTATLAVTLDGARAVLPYGYGTSTGYVLSPIASVIDEKNAGAISGSIDPSALAAGYGPVVVSAEVPDAAGSHHVVVQRRVVGSSGAFTLYPLPAPSSGTTSYDLVISSSGAQTVIIRSVPISSGAVTSPVVVQATPILLTPASPGYANVSAQAVALPGGARVDFYQTIAAGGEIPYLIDSSALDLLTRRLPGDSFALGSGPVNVGDYASGSSISFSTAAPVEGQGGYVIGTEGAFRRDALALAPSLINGLAGAPTPVLPPFPAVAAGGAAGTLALTLTSPVGEFDSGFVVVAAGNRVVESVNVGTLLATGGGTINIVNVPAGRALAPTAGVPYRLSVRAWNSTSPSASLVRVATTMSTVLGDAARASAAIDLP